LNESRDHETESQLTNKTALVGNMNFIEFPAASCIPKENDKLHGYFRH